jgi:hypothetical protein
MTEPWWGFRSDDLEGARRISNIRELSGKVSSFLGRKPDAVSERNGIAPSRALWGDHPDTARKVFRTLLAHASRAGELLEADPLRRGWHEIVFDRRFSEAMALAGAFYRANPESEILTFSNLVSALSATCAVDLSRSKTVIDAEDHEPGARWVWIAKDDIRAFIGLWLLMPRLWAPEHKADANSRHAVMVLIGADGLPRLGARMISYKADGIFSLWGKYRYSDLDICYRKPFLRMLRTVAPRLASSGDPSLAAVDGHYPGLPYGNSPRRLSYHVERGLLSLVTEAVDGGINMLRYVDGLPHCDTGPAFTSGDGRSFIWYRDGLLHRPDGVAHIAVSDRETVEEWYVDGQLHRDDGPARVVKSTNLQGLPIERVEWFQRGQRHNLYGPAVVKSISTGVDRFAQEEAWYVQDKLHNRDGGPSLIQRSRRAMGVEPWIIRQEWYVHGVLHRSDGPSSIAKGTTKWYRQGRLHREGGPAVTEPGRESWLRNGHLHRVDGPAVSAEAYVGSPQEVSWYLFGRLHRRALPARIIGDVPEWFEHGEAIPPPDVGDADVSS